MLNAGKLWSDISLMQDLEEQLTSSSGLIINATNQIDRGCEGYTFEKNFDKKELINEMNQSKKMILNNKMVASTNPFEKIETDVCESFGVNTDNLRNSINNNKQKFKQKPHFNNKNIKWKQNKHFSKQIRHKMLTIKKDKRKTVDCDDLKYFLDKNFTSENLFNANFPPDATISELGELIAKALGEKLPEVIIYIVQKIGKEMALELFNECKKIEKSGGLLVLNQKRRRTPGGVFLYLFKQNQSISDEIKNDSFQYCKVVQQRNLKEQLEIKKRKEHQKILDKKKEIENLKNLPTVVETFSHKLEDNNESEMNN